jgi:hypothetical protein
LEEKIKATDPKKSADAGAKPQEEAAENQEP